METSGTFPNGDQWILADADFFSTPKFDDDGNPVLDSEGEQVMEYPYMGENLMMLRASRKINGRTAHSIVTITRTALEDQYDKVIEYASRESNLQFERLALTQ